MTTFERGIQLYLVVLAFIATLTAVWGANQFLFRSTAEATGWPVMIGIAGTVVTVGKLVHHRRTTSDPNAPRPYPWSSNDW